MHKICRRHSASCEKQKGFGETLREQYEVSRGEAETYSE